MFSDVYLGNKCAYKETDLRATLRTGLKKEKHADTGWVIMRWRDCGE